MSSAALFLGSSQDTRQFSLPELLATLTFVGEMNSIEDWRDLARSKSEVDHNTVAGFCRAVMPDNFPRDHNDRVSALIEFFVDKRNSLLNVPVCGVDLKRLMQDNQDKVKTWCQMWRLTPTSYDFPDEFMGPIIGNSMDLIPLRVRQDVLSEVVGWLQGFKDIDSNLISFIWLQPDRLKG
jgi:hypothetical protein